MTDKGLSGERTEILYGVKIPKRLQGDRDQAILYAAGFMYAQHQEEGPPVPDEIKDIWEQRDIPNSFRNVRDPALREYSAGFIVGGGRLGSALLESIDRPGTRAEDNRQ